MATSPAKDSGTRRYTNLIRQVAVILLAFAQVAASIYVTRSGRDDFTRPFPGGDPPIIPATYAFAVWGPIFLGSIVFAVYHALPSQRDRTLMREIGWWVASSFAATALWLIVAMNPARIWGTVLMLVLLTTCLGVALVAITRAQQARPFSKADRFAMAAPLSVFAGWGTVATFANIAAALRQTGVTGPGDVERALTIVMLVVATVVASIATRALRGNVWYAATVLWAVIAIAIANVSRETRPADAVIAMTALLAGTVVLGTVLRTRRTAVRGDF